MATWSCLHFLPPLSLALASLVSGTQLLPTDRLSPPPWSLHVVPAAGQHTLAARGPGTGLAAPCTHCGTVLVAESGALRQCCACLDVYCSCCSVIDYEEREDRVFCLSCLEEQVGWRPRGRDAV